MSISARISPPERQAAPTLKLPRLMQDKKTGDVFLVTREVAHSKTVTGVCLLERAVLPFPSAPSMPMPPTAGIKCGDLAKELMLASLHDFDSAVSLQNND